MEISTGQRTTITLVSKTKGPLDPRMVQNLDYTPTLEEKKFQEFNNLEDALVYTTFKGCDGRFTVAETDTVGVSAVLMDLPMTTSVVVDDPSNYKKFHCYLNAKNMAGTFFEGLLFKECTVKGAPYTSTTEDAAQVAYDFASLNVYRVRGGAIQYTRCRTSGFSGTTWSGDKQFSGIGPWTATLDYAVQTVTIGDASKTYLLCLRNGSAATSGFTVSGTTFTVTSGANDSVAFELFTTYVPV